MRVPRSTSNSLALARAFKNAGSGVEDFTCLSGALTPAQSGAAMRLRELTGLQCNSQALECIRAAEPEITSAFCGAGYARSAIGSPIEVIKFERVCARWFQEPSPTNDILAGYWLADAFLRGVGPEEAACLAGLLSSAPAEAPTVNVKNVRRYPTGGISEKQALILPPLLFLLSGKFRWCSSFLVARKLAHTGGTVDKLAVLPGFTPWAGTKFSAWRGTNPPVIYFSAGKNFCPRDAAMYRLRGETGTVADLGLMAASIMAKQIAAPVDTFALDVLYGDGAFLGSIEEATKFGELCAGIGERYGIEVVAMLRETYGLNGRTVGASTEILEAIEVMRGERNYITAKREIRTAASFLSCFARMTDEVPGRMLMDIEASIASGLAFESMLQLWGEHGVDRDFLEKVKRSPRIALLGDIAHETIRAESAGDIKFDAVALADYVNIYINRNYVSSEGGDGIAKGGVELLVDDGDYVSSGQPVARIYGEDETSRKGVFREFFCVANSAGR